MKATLLIISCILGVLFVTRSSIRYYRELKAKKSGEHTTTDIWFNYPLQVLWNLYLLVFFVGLVVNNLVFK